MNVYLPQNEGSLKEGHFIVIWKKSNYLCCLYNLHILPTMHHNTFSFYIIMTYRCVILILVATVE